MLPWTAVVELDRLKLRAAAGVGWAARDALSRVARWMAESDGGFVRVQAHEVGEGRG